MQLDVVGGGVDGHVDAIHPGGDASIALGRGVCTQFDKVESYTYGSLWMVKNSDGFFTDANDASGIIAAAVAIYCPEHERAITDDPGLTVGSDGNVSIDTGDDISDLLPG